jgi:outer membrane protein assembly factor BamB
MRRTLSLPLLVIALASMAQAGNWPAWRGPQGTGVSDERGVPLTWSPTENIRWKVELPGPGNSTPIVWGGRVFVSGAENSGKVRALMCFNRQNGSLSWKAEVPHDKEETTHATNPYCASSPVTDGERVIVWHGSAGLFAYDIEGRELWRKNLGEFNHIWGNASSPVLHENLVILSAGPGTTAFLVALDKRTGEEAWRKEPPTAPSSKAGDYHGSWSTPVLYKTRDGRTEMLLSLPTQLVSYDPATGEELWNCRGLTKLVYTSPLVGKDAAVAMSGYHGSALGVRLGGKGDVTETHRLWVHEMKNPQRVGSGVLVGDYVYILNENMLAWCIHVPSGEIKWQARVSEESKGGGRSWCSMSHVDGRLYVLDEKGTTHVLEPNPEGLKLLATNSLDELTRGSHAFSDGQIFIRTYKNLWCVAEPARSNP